ncbi:hypothetical protein C2845_PM13G11840 [Panicum miliaceum]|uniref:F-box domain-containing protein n=1 Tax=Panicum miliaceum TaxID=4540 RepID=A0A3L6RJ39_PANMI|nr:hypothetical protein C2845_PM13G11840 [Panicum miliaceum]
MAGDRLSTLPDRALHRVLSFVDVHDIPRTSVLSRRWRTLWREVDAVNLDTRSYWHHGYEGGSVGRALFRDALAALGADGRCPVRKLGVHVESYYQIDYIEDAMRTSPGMDAVLAAPRYEAWRSSECFCAPSSAIRAVSTCYPQAVPCQSLRVLELAGHTLGTPGAAVFGRLETLKMVFIHSSVENLQAMLDAAPNLARFWLEYVSSFKSEELGDDSYNATPQGRVLLRCPNATVAVTLMHCHHTDGHGLNLDAPSVRSLR